mmetsp:Transcript_9991/g.26641  ORF Transcript_9991/g.26641 Transcript_9991/m.26641 type:complete len:497 (+) Transcript_9991:151-1641(+)
METREDAEVGVAAVEGLRKQLRALEAEEERAERWGVPRIAEALRSACVLAARTEAEVSGTTKAVRACDTMLRLVLTSLIARSRDGRGREGMKVLLDHVRRVIGASYGLSTTRRITDERHRGRDVAAAHAATSKQLPLRAHSRDGGAHCYGSAGEEQAPEVLPNARDEAVLNVLARAASSQGDYVSRDSSKRAASDLDVQELELRKAAEALVATRPPDRAKRLKLYHSHSPADCCHLCARRVSEVRVAVCCNFQKQLCRKVVCELCFHVSKRDFDAARLHNADWQCPHCLQECPDHAQCKFGAAEIAHVSRTQHALRGVHGRDLNVGSPITLRAMLSVAHQERPASILAPRTRTTERSDSIGVPARGLKPAERASSPFGTGADTGRTPVAPLPPSKAVDVGFPCAERSKPTVSAISPHSSMQRSVPSNSVTAPVKTVLGSPGRETAKLAAVARHAPGAESIPVPSASAVHTNASTAPAVVPGYSRWSEVRENPMYYY